MKKIWLILCLGLGLASGTVQAASGPEIYWVDVDGGGGTLIITPAKESILIDTGWPGERDAVRIRDAAAKAGVTRIDFLILTHFHLDHFGGAANVAALMPVGAVYDNGIPAHDPDGGDDKAFFKSIEPYRELKAERRQVVHPGDTLPLKQAETGPKISFRFLAAAQKRIDAPAGAPKNPLCDGLETREPDTSDNKNSVVSLLQYGSFRFFDGGDLTWNMEGKLVCPVNLPGPVDVYQANHHGVNISNNPLLVRSLSPTVAVMNNGARKGGSSETAATLRSTPGIKAVYQVHKDVVHGPNSNTADEFIANLDEQCAANPIHLKVAPDAQTYTVSIPATGHKQVFHVRE